MPTNKFRKGNLAIINEGVHGAGRIVRVIQPHGLEHVDVEFQDRQGGSTRYHNSWLKPMAEIDIEISEFL